MDTTQILVAAIIGGAVGALVGAAKQSAKKTADGEGLRITFGFLHTTFAGIPFLALAFGCYMATVNPKSTGDMLLILAVCGSLLLVVFLILLFIISYRVEVDRTGIAKRTAFGSRVIEWKDVSIVKRSWFNDWVVVNQDGKTTMRITEYAYGAAEIVPYFESILAERSVNA